MAAANAPPRLQRHAILGSPLPGFCLVVDCLDLRCPRDRTFAMADLAALYGGQRTVAETLRRMRCRESCEGRVAAAWLVTGPALNGRVRPLLGPEARD